ncbi:hypothetical protein Cgig2_004296 [Carnegiea gigantea]|uniref:Uncharacterized protein n=1 Tax=Carnegiea gigantea TaxID=171969 RepID=A0A9Q1JH78_9CARY|nr:hypothetical protein Cgig2_004296 [Carnegiea gigantea]
MELMWTNTMIGKIIGDHDRSAAEVEDAVNNTWVKRANIQVSRMEDILLFRCSNAQDKEDLIQLENVVIIGALLVLKRCNPHVPLKEWRFDDTALWVQIHGVLSTHIISEVVVSLAQVVGQVVDVDLGGGKERGIMRVKVRINLDHPVLPGAYLDAGEEDGLHWYLSNMRVFADYVRTISVLVILLNLALFLWRRQELMMQDPCAEKELPVQAASALGVVVIVIVIVVAQRRN